MYPWSADDLAEAYSQVVHDSQCWGMQPEEGAASGDKESSPLSESVGTASEFSSFSAQQDLGGLSEEAERANCPVTPLSILESLLFVGDPKEPFLAGDRLIRILGLGNLDELAGLIRELNSRYEATGRPYRVIDHPSGYRLALLPEYDALRQQVLGGIRQSRLSQAAIEVLAIVAYRQPITGEEITDLRGRPSAHLLAQLTQKGLIVGEPPPQKTRPIRYRTTERFLRLFRLERLEDLPQVEDITGQ